MLSFRHAVLLFHLLKNICYFPLLVLKGTYHYWIVCFRSTEPRPCGGFNIPVRGKVLVSQSWKWTQAPFKEGGSPKSLVPLSLLPKADLLTFWFLLSGLVLVMAPQGSPSCGSFGQASGFLEGSSGGPPGAVRRGGSGRRRAAQRRRAAVLLHAVGPGAEGRAHPRGAALAPLLRGAEPWVLGCAAASNSERVFSLSNTQAPEYYPGSRPFWGSSTWHASDDRPRSPDQKKSQKQGAGPLPGEGGPRARLLARERLPLSERWPGGGRGRVALHLGPELQVPAPRVRMEICAVGLAWDDSSHT